MYSAAVGGEGAVALQLREAKPGELDERLAIACHQPELLADLLHASVDIGKQPKRYLQIKQELLHPEKANGLNADAIVWSIKHQSRAS